MTACDRWCWGFIRRARRLRRIRRVRMGVFRARITRRRVLESVKWVCDGSRVVGVGVVGICIGGCECDVCTVYMSR